MFRRSRAGDWEAERGFTLIEVMIVVMIISILVAIALPVFWGTRERATDRAAQVLLTNGVKAVEVIRSDDERLSTITPPQLAGAEAAIAWLAGSTPAEARQDEISVESGVVAGEGYVILSTHTVLGDCLAIRLRETAAATFQRVVGNVCPADSFDPAFGWVNSWPPR